MLRWSGCSRYRFHGSCVITTSGRSVRIASHDLGPGREVVLELAVDASEEETCPLLVRRRDRRTGSGRGALLVLTPGDERGGVGVGVPRALRPVRAHEVVHDRAGGSPLGERRPGAELDVVRVGADGERAARRVEVDRRRGRQRRGVAAQRRLARIVRNHGGSSSCSIGWRRSAGVSTSSDRHGSRRTSTRKPVVERHRPGAYGTSWRRSSR